MARILGRTTSNDFVECSRHGEHSELNDRLAKWSTFVDRAATVPPLKKENLGVCYGYWSEGIPNMNVITVQCILEKTQAKASSAVGSSKVCWHVKAT